MTALFHFHSYPPRFVIFSDTEVTSIAAIFYQYENDQLGLLASF